MGMPVRIDDTDLWQALFVYKFACNGQLTLLAYEYDPYSRKLLLLGSHEDCYRELKKGSRADRPPDSTLWGLRRPASVIHIHCSSSRLSRISASRSMRSLSR